MIWKKKFNDCTFGSLLKEIFSWHEIRLKRILNELIIRSNVVTFTPGWLFVHQLWRTDKRFWIEKMKKIMEGWRWFSRKKVVVSHTLKYFKFIFGFKTLLFYFLFFTNIWHVIKDIHYARSKMVNNLASDISQKEWSVFIFC